MIIKNININSEINRDPLCLTIGNFDGLHKGHQFIINKVVKESKELNLVPAVLSFKPHPRIFFNTVSENFNIITETHKEELLESLGVKIFFKLKFNQSVSSVLPYDFVKNFLIKKLNLRSLLIGQNFKFGKDREGDVNLLKKINLNEEFKLNIINFVKTEHSNVIFSSSIIREKIKQGKVQDVTNLLGRPWIIKGIVQEGDRRASQMNFPTANLLSPDTIHPKKGVYCVRVTFENRNFHGIANFGRRPTFGGEKVLLEVNIFGFDSEIYGKELTIEFLAFIREEIKFDSFDKLKKQVNKDVHTAKSYFIKN